ncbi:MAG TPA: hypothetical protein VGO25_07110 [Rhodanobacteraceae bacterium]|jgi:hypothetical protein|nr:hypothetical protein [Rhodanobacteraceae bacterium]
MAHAESGNGDRAEALQAQTVAIADVKPGIGPSRTAPADFGRPDIEPSDDLDRLKDILLDDERRAIDALEGRIADVDRSQRELPARLLLAIERAQQGPGAERFASALALPVTQALGAAVRENRQIIIDVLFPVIGPAIRKAIAEALRNLVTDMNSAVESSFTPRGLSWRIEAWRSGVPYAQVVLKYTLNYRIDHVFLIERDSGLVLDRESAPHLPELDADAIGGMLTAIGEFVRDSVDRDGASTLDSARVGEHLLWVIEGPRANLACFIHGVPPAGLRALLERRLEDIHARIDDGDDAADASWRSSLRPDELMREARAAEPGSRASPSRWPMILILLVALGLIAWAIVRHERENAGIESLRARLGAHAGFVLTSLDKTSEGVTVHGLLDPDAEPIEAASSRDASATSLKLDTVGYVSTDDAIIERRTRRLLAAPSSVTIGVKDGVLALGGSAAAAWVDAARERAVWIAGVQRVDFGVTPEADAAALARQQLDDLVRMIPTRRITFVRDVDLGTGADAVLDQLVGDAKRAAVLASTAGAGIELTAVGTNDDPGSNAINARLRASRARWLADALTARGVSGVQTAADEDEDALQARQRSAFVRVRVDGAAR